MATLYLHVGQAGCQLGQSFWAPLADEISNSETLQLALCHGHRGHEVRQGHRSSAIQGHRSNGIHRSIFVDTESKALHDATRAIGAKRIGAGVKFGVAGRGSCFPMGYGPEWSSDELDERFDFVRQVHVICHRDCARNYLLVDPGLHHLEHQQRKTRWFGSRFCPFWGCEGVPPWSQMGDMVRLDTDKEG